MNAIVDKNYKDHAELRALATEVNTALTVGKASLDKLRESTSGNWLSQAWNSSDINRKMVDSLEAVHLLGKAQLSFQKITDGLIKESLSKQQIFARQQEQLSLQQSELSKHSKEIERLVVLTDQTDEVEALEAKIDSLQVIVANLDLGQIGAKFTIIDTKFGEELSLLRQSIKAVEDQSGTQCEQISNDMTAFMVRIEKTKISKWIFGIVTAICVSQFFLIAYLLSNMTKHL